MRRSRGNAGAWQNPGMASTKITHLMLDFFGTIVDYSPSRTKQDYSRSYDLVRQCGAALTYDEFLALVDETFDDFDARSAMDLTEFSMDESTAAVLGQALGRAATAEEVAAFVAAYLTEWNAAVVYPNGMADLLRDLADAHRLAVVSNTHSPTLVGDHLDALGVSDLFDAVVLSVEIGRRKPHPAIYRTALDRLGIDAGAALFVGDTYAADYQGPRQLGIRALLIDPRRSTPTPESHRLQSLFDLRDRVAW